MLSGEILIRSPLSVALLPPPSLIQICKAMAAIATLASSQNIDDDDIFLENGLLSYENPNYHMDPQRMERNSHLYEEILSELHNQQSSLTSSKTSKSHIVNNRKDYARIDIGSMGVDLKENFSTSEKQLLFDSSPTESKTKSDQIPEKDEKIIRNRQQQQQQQQQQNQQLQQQHNKIKDTNNKQDGGGNIGNGGISSGDGDGGGVKQIKYIPGNLNADDLYALPNKIRNHQIHHRNNANANANANDDDDNNDDDNNDIIDTIRTFQTKTTIRSTKTATRKNLKIGNSKIENSNNDNDGIGLNVGENDNDDDEDEDDDDDEDEEKGKKEEIEGIEDKDINKDLPPGWEKHEDNDGPYYWHIKSGTIQREPPTWPKCNNIIQTGNTISTTASGIIGNGTKDIKTPIQTTQNSSFITTTRSPNNNTFQAFYGHQRDSLGNRIQETQSLSVTRSSTSSALDQEEERRRREDLTYKRRSYPLKSDSDRPIRFAVRSLGWVEIAEEDLTPERSSKAVNKCIVDLSLGRNDLLDVVGRWGDGKDLFMDLDEGALKLIDPENLTILNTQPIHTIRVWGVGRDNGRDFAYVARDRLTRIHMCHVFRCDTAARTIANTLRDICKRIMIERSLQLDANSSCINANSNRNAIRPTDLPTENRKWSRHPQSFPTPMEEPKKILKAQYLGFREVPQATGMDILNNAIESVLRETKPEQWENVNVSVAPSMISVHNTGEDARLITECRVRYLSFLGIGKNVKNCAFIMHTAQDKFVVHVFHCEPSSGALCKTIEAACKLRYQKCLDAHPENRLSSESNTPSKGIGATIKNLMSSLTLKKDKASSS